MRTYVSTSYIQKDQEFVASIDVSSVSLCTSCWKNTDRIAVSYTSLSLPPPTSCYPTYKFRTESVIGEPVIQLHSALIDFPKANKTLWPNKRSVQKICEMKLCYQYFVFSSACLFCETNERISWLFLLKACGSDRHNIDLYRLTIKFVTNSRYYFKKD